MKFIDVMKRKREKRQGVKRSDGWPEARKEHLVSFPVCVVCGSKKNLQVHHIHPFHLYPELELNPDNLITLCEDDGNGCDCHLFIGHLGNFRTYNPDVKEDAEIWNQKIKNRKEHK